MPNQSARAFLYSLQEGDDRARTRAYAFFALLPAKQEATLNATHIQSANLGEHPLIVELKYVSRFQSLLANSIFSFLLPLID